MIARMQLHRVCPFRLAPLNQGWQRAIEQPVAVGPDRDLPLQQALGGFAAGMNDGAAVNALVFPGMPRVLNAVGIGHEVNQSR